MIQLRFFTNRRISPFGAKVPTVVHIVEIGGGETRVEGLRGATGAGILRQWALT